MSTTAEFPYQVVVTELPPIRAAYVDCVLDEQSGNFDERIREGFEVVKAWVAERGYKLANLRVIGIPHVSDTRLTGYECCVELPESVSMTSGKIGTKQLVGGRYAVLTLEKDSATIGEAIGRFHREYVPQHRLTIDRQRPSYEIYSERFMDYCLPIE